MSILITFKNCNLAFGQKVIFDQAELSVNRGDKIGLIGLNGQGKSTLFQILMGQVTPDISTPPFICDRSNDPFEIFLVPQELEIEKFRHLSIENYYLAFYPRLYEVYQKLEQDFSNENLLNEFQELGGWDIQNAYMSYLKTFELEQPERTVAYLSGGEKRKMALSIGLSSPAEFILWDEPTNHLDIETIEKFEELLINTKNTFMIISHDRYLLNSTTNSIFHIERGKINQFKGTYLDYLDHLENKEAELQKNLEKRENRHRRELAWMRQGIKARGTRSKKRVEGFHNLQKEISELKARSKTTVSLDLLHSGRKSKVLLTIENGKFSFAENLIFSDLNLTVTKSDKIALIGRNGTGKSTLIKIFSEQLQLTSGKFKCADDLKIIVFDQNRESLDVTKTPMQIVGEGNDFVFLGNGAQIHVNSYLQKFLFTSDQVHRPIETLSGGEKNRLQLALFMKQAADIWVFDEPTNDLDIETLELLEKELAAYEAAVIIIGHDRAFLDNTCQKTWLVHEQKIEVFNGGYSQVAPYLEALELEKKLKLIPPEKSSKNYKNNNQNNQKRLKELADCEHEIEKYEILLKNLEQKLVDFDYSSVDQNQLGEIHQEKEQVNLKLEQLYQTWEKLS